MLRCRWTGPEWPEKQRMGEGDPMLRGKESGTNNSGR
jgi:hypothetical protein